jgi:hypothetical protein
LTFTGRLGVLLLQALGLGISDISFVKMALANASVYTPTRDLTQVEERFVHTPMLAINNHTQHPWKASNQRKLLVSEDDMHS